MQKISKLRPRSAIGSTEEVKKKQEKKMLEFSLFSSSLFWKG